MQIVAKSTQRQSGKIGGRQIQFGQRIAQMLDDAVPDAPPQLMVRCRSLNQTLHEISPGFFMPLPNLFPRLVGFPVCAGVEKIHALN